MKEYITSEAAEDVQRRLLDICRDVDLPDDQPGAALFFLGLALSGVGLSYHTNATGVAEYPNIKETCREAGSLLMDILLAPAPPEDGSTE